MNIDGQISHLNALQEEFKDLSKECADIYIQDKQRGVTLSDYDPIVHDDFPLFTKFKSDFITFFKLNRFLGVFENDFKLYSKRATFSFLNQMGALFADIGNELRILNEVEPVEDGSGWQHFRLIKNEADEASSVYVEKEMEEVVDKYTNKPIIDKVFFDQPQFIEWKTKMIEFLQDSSIRDSLQTNRVLEKLNSFNGLFDTARLDRVKGDLNALFYSWDKLSIREPRGIAVEDPIQIEEGEDSTADLYERQRAELLATVRNEIAKIKDKESNRENGAEKTMEVNNKVFIVHGHDEETLYKVKSFIDDRGCEGIILKEKASSGMTVIEKLEHYTDVRFGIVLYTACDEGKAKEEANYKKRARQNVVFEHGYLVSKLGRANIVALVESGVETPGDLSGVVYISMDSDWKFELLKEMKAAGLEVDL